LPNAIAVSQPVNLVAPQPTGAASTPPKTSGSGFTFHDFLNIINPLQHIPVVSTIYREITGDTLKPISNILGGALFGGVIGLASSAVDAIVQETTGKDIGAHVMATLGLHHDSTDDSGGGHQVAASGASPVPAFLVAEAQADRAAHANAAPAGVARPTLFWQSLQRGGTGVSHGAAGRPVVTIGPPKPLPGGGQISAAPQASPSAPQPILRPASDGAATIISSSQPAASAAVSQPAATSINPRAQQPMVPTPAGIQPLPKAQIPEMMMQALAKYQAMHKAPQAQVVDQTN